MVVKELIFWKNNVQALNGRLCVRDSPPVTVEIKGDASASGCGSLVSGKELRAARLFSSEERLAHSTWRELENVHFSLVAMKEELRGRAVNFLVDNQSAALID